MPPSPDPHPTANPLRPSLPLALQAWRDLHAAHTEQERRLRETDPDADEWGTLATRFSATPEEPSEVAALRELFRSDETWLDVGAGGGRISTSIARDVREVVTVDPSPGMDEAMRRSVAEAGLTNVRMMPTSPWPPTPELAARIGPVDVAFAAHVVYFVDEIGPFLDALEQQAGRLCVIAAGNHAGPTPPADLWEAVHGEPYAPSPAAPELLAVLTARGCSFDVRTVPRPAVGAAAGTLDELLPLTRRRLLTREGSRKDGIVRDFLAAHYTSPDGSVGLPAAMTRVAIISWQPPAAAG